MTSRSGGLHGSSKYSPVTQHARQMTWELHDRAVLRRYLIHDHDTKFSGLFDNVVESEGIEIVDIPYEVPNANAFAERWVRSVREECLDKLIILNVRRLAPCLDRVSRLSQYVSASSMS